MIKNKKYDRRHIGVRLRRGSIEDEIASAKAEGDTMTRAQRARESRGRHAKKKVEKIDEDEVKEVPDVGEK